VSGGWARRLAAALAAGRRGGDEPQRAPVCLACKPFRIVPAGSGAAEPARRERVTAAARDAPAPRGC